MFSKNEKKANEKGGLYNLENLLMAVCERYNDFKGTGYYIKFDVTALQILQEGAIDKADLKNKIRKYDLIEYQKKKNDDYQELVLEFKAEQPKSKLLTFIYIELIANALPNSFFEKINLERKRLIQITLSIMFYNLFLQTYIYGEKPLSTTQRKWLLGRDDFYLGIEEIKKVCWQIEKEDFETFCDKFAFDLENKEVSKLKGEKFYKNGDTYFILCIEEFLEYVLIKTERLFKDSCTNEEFSEYQRKKGFAFEEFVFSQLQSFYTNAVHSVYYYPQKDKVAEIDILLQEEDYLLIIECKSGTIELKSASTDEEIRKKIDNKVKKAYNTLENANNYVTLNERYKFSNKSNVVEGESKDKEVLCLHLSMYPLDAISSNVHVLNEKYIGESGNPKITMSFEHFLAICLDSHVRGMTVGTYLKQRKKNIIEHPKTHFDNNELDLYYQLTNKGNRLMLSESLENGILENFNDNIRIVTTFHNSSGKEFRPASEMLKDIDNRLLYSMFKIAKTQYGLNKRYMVNLNEYLLINTTDFN